jgi:hypothetical protein
VETKPPEARGRPGWLAILTAPFNPRRVFLRSLLIPLEQAFFQLLIAIGLALFVIPGLILIVVAWGRIHRRYIQVASLGAHGVNRFPAWSGSRGGLGTDFKFGVYAVYLLVMSFAPLAAVVAAGVYLSAASDLEPGVVWALGAAGGLASLWVVFCYLMGLTLTAARGLCVCNPFAILVALLKCLPHLVVTAIPATLAPLFYLSLLLAAAFGVAVLFRPSLPEEGKHVFNLARQVVQERAVTDEAQAELDKLRAEWEKLVAENEESIQQVQESPTTPNEAWGVAAALVGIQLLVILGASVFVHLTNLAWLNPLGLIVRRRQQALGWLWSADYDPQDERPQ